MAWALRASSPATVTQPTTLQASFPALTMGAACSVDDRVIVTATVERNGGTPSVTSVTGTFCGTFTKDSETPVVTNGSFQCVVYVWSAPVTSGGTPVLTINTTNVDTGSAAAAAYSGLDNSASSAAVDVQASIDDDAASTTTPTVTTGATTAANELVISGVGDDGESATFTEAGGLTRRAFLANANGDIAIGDKDSGTSGSAITTNWTGASTAGWGICAVVYKLAGGAAPTSTLALQFLGI